MANKYHKKAVQKTLEANKDKPFVQRVMYPDVHPVRQNPDGSVSTHLMSTAEVDGKYIAYPTMTKNRSKGKSGKHGLKERLGRAAITHALRTRNFIEFGSEKEADDFARNYKQVWEN